MSEVESEVAPRHIVNLLCDPDVKKRREGLRALYPGVATLVVQVNGQAQSMFTSLDTADPAMFATILWAAQQMGQAFGLRLQWVSAEPRRPQLVVAQPDQLPPA